MESTVDAVMNGDLTDGSIILMHDIHETSVQAALQIIPQLTEKGYKLMTVSELAKAKGVELQPAEERLSGKLCVWKAIWQRRRSDGGCAGMSEGDGRKHGYQSGPLQRRRRVQEGTAAHEGRKASGRFRGRHGLCGRLCGRSQPS